MDCGSPGNTQGGPQPPLVSLQGVSKGGNAKSPFGASFLHAFLRVQKSMGAPGRATPQNNGAFLAPAGAQYPPKTPAIEFVIPFPGQRDRLGGYVYVCKNHRR